MQDNIVQLVAKTYPDCFSTCPGRGTNITTPCFRNCYEETIGAGMEADAMANVWDDAFDSDDAETGGCPPVIL